MFEYGCLSLVAALRRLMLLSRRLFWRMHLSHHTLDIHEIGFVYVIAMRVIDFARLRSLANIPGHGPLHRIDSRRGVVMVRPTKVHAVLWDIGPSKSHD